MINVPLMRKVLEYIEANPEEHDQATWGHKRDGDPLRGEWCGTVACMAGHTVLLTANPEIKSQWVFGYLEVYVNGERKGIAKTAAGELGLDEKQKDRMFHQAETREDLWRMAHEFTDGEIEIPLKYQDD